MTRIPRATSTPTIQRPSSTQRWPVTGIVRVDTGDDFFLPEVVTITVGSSVRWYHIGEEAHNAVAFDGSWGTVDFGIGETAEYRFGTPGRFPYRCTLAGPGMSGIVVVVAPP
ncbi:MAG: hypothetical protein HZB53_10620 [Chloroflexi bacterium]|nr:hypothetical protein [Chloroflexota bacterium]